MSNDRTVNDAVKHTIVFFGRRCPFSTIPFEHVLRAGINISALVLSSASPIGPAVRQRPFRPSIRFGTATQSIDQIAGEHGIPVYDVRRPLGDELSTVLQRYAPDILLASCFPWRIPAALREIATLGGINVHPSLLPRYRGPDPLFWAYRNGERRWGVSVHQLTDSFDAGAILAQKEFALPDETPGDQLERSSAEAGAELLLEVITQTGAELPERRAQDHGVATYQTWPNDEQLRVEPGWTVQHALNFVVGVRPLGYEPTIETARGTRVVNSARAADNLPCVEETWLNKTTVCQPFSDGTIEFCVT